MPAHDYQIVYSATDRSGNTGSASRVVSVVDTLPPVLTLNGNAVIQWEANTTYVVRISWKSFFFLSLIQECACVAHNLCHVLIP